MTLTWAPSSLGSPSGGVSTILRANHCLSLVFAVLDRASKGWRGVEMTPAVVRRLQNLRRQLFGGPGEEDESVAASEVVTAAA
jgi:hypothetical protein